MPYQLHSKQTAAGSVRLPGICLGDEGNRDIEEKKRWRGVRRTRRNCKNDERGWRRGTNRDGEESSNVRVWTVCVCVWDMPRGLGCRELISP